MGDGEFSLHQLASMKAENLQKVMDLVEEPLEGRKWGERKETVKK